jgi:cysteine dioxygenase|tara:strand:- start:2105 stop:2629 length:525 start_codon:yes stop_codon:yes gene_type:complete
MVEQVALTSETRDILLSECSGISLLVKWLDEIDRRPGLDELEKKLNSIEVNIPALRDCIGYAKTGYQRNVIKKNEFYELVAICWTPDQSTPIHDHVGSDCAFKIIDGISTETTYNLNDMGLAYPIGNREYHAGEICAAAEPDIHRISNNSNNELINLHVYTPPLHAYNVYKPAN